MANMDYSEDGKEILINVRNYNTQENEVVGLSVEMIDTLLELPYQVRHQLTDIMSFRSITKEYDVETVAISELVGVDLTGKVVRIWYRNWEDSEWLESSDVTSVRKDSDGSYGFVYNEEIEACNRGECADDEGNNIVEGHECNYDQLSNMWFHNECETVEILTQKAVKNV